MELKNLSILCALECSTPEHVSAVLPEYELTFADNEFEFVELARERRFDLILTSSLKADERYPRACSLIRMFDPRIPLLFITDFLGITEEEAASFDALVIPYEGELKTPDVVRRRISELLVGETLIFNLEKV